MKFKMNYHPILKDEKHPLLSHWEAGIWLHSVDWNLLQCCNPTVLLRWENPSWIYFWAGSYSIALQFTLVQQLSDDHADLQQLMLPHQYLFLTRGMQESRDSWLSLHIPSLLCSWPPGQTLTFPINLPRANCLMQPSIYIQYVFIRMNEMYSLNRTYVTNQILPTVSHWVLRGLAVWYKRKQQSIWGLPVVW